MAWSLAAYVCVCVISVSAMLNVRRADTKATAGLSSQGASFITWRLKCIALITTQQAVLALPYRYILYHMNMPAVSTHSVNSSFTGEYHATHHSLHTLTVSLYLHCMVFNSFAPYIINTLVMSHGTIFSSISASFDLSSFVLLVKEVVHSI